MTRKSSTSFSTSRLPWKSSISFQTCESSYGSNTQPFVAKGTEVRVRYPRTGRFSFLVRTGIAKLPRISLNSARIWLFRQNDWADGGGGGGGALATRGRERDVETGKFPKVHGRQSGRNCGIQFRNTRSRCNHRAFEIHARTPGWKNGGWFARCLHHFSASPLSSTSVRQLFPRFSFHARFANKAPASNDDVSLLPFSPLTTDPLSQAHIFSPEAFCLHPSRLHSSTERFLFVAPTSPIRSLSFVYSSSSFFLFSFFLKFLEKTIREWREYGRNFRFRRNFPL